MFRFVYRDLDISHKQGKASEPAADYMNHLHCFNELIFFLRGDVTYHIGAESKKLESGDLLVIQEGKYHFAEVKSDSGYERYVVKFSDAFLPGYIKEKLKNLKSFYGVFRSGLNIFKRFDLYVDKFCDKDMYTLCACDIVKLLVGICLYPSETDSGNDGLISKLVNYIDENIDKPLCAKSLAKEFNFSVSYISDEFKKHVKIPIMQYVRHKKVIEAHRLLASGMKKYAVAEALGFENYTTFYRAYMRIMGVAPSEIDSARNMAQK